MLRELKIWYASLGQKWWQIYLFMTQVDFMLFLRLWVRSIPTLPNPVRCFPNLWICSQTLLICICKLFKAFKIWEISFSVSLWISHSTHLHVLTWKSMSFTRKIFKLSFWWWLCFYCNNMDISWVISCFRNKISIQGSQEYAFELIQDSLIFPMNFMTQLSI